jgi:AraC-like DNA-binding protein
MRDARVRVLASRVAAACRQRLHDSRSRLVDSGRSGSTTGTMFLHFSDRPSPSPLVERVWTCRSSGAGAFRSVAASHCEMVVSRLESGTSLTIRGPETRATIGEAPAHSEWLGIRFRLGTFLPRTPPGTIRDRRDVTLPQLDDRTFSLDGKAWEYPAEDDVEAFVARLVRAGLVARDPVVDRVLDARPQTLSTRSLERRFRRATGLTHGLHRQIERARHATSLLASGAAITAVVHAAGYFDQAHLTRSLVRLVGQTPGQIARREQQLSFLYKTDARCPDTLAR